ncbi:guanyl-specific ribonuclease [Spirosoma pomorum]
MPSLRLFFQFCLLIVGLFSSLACRTDQGESNRQDVFQDDHRPERQSHKRRHQSENYRSNQAQPSTRTSNRIPDKVIKVLDYVRKNGQAPEGYVGGRVFGNFENHLPRNDLSGDKIRYQEWDVNPKVRGQNRGAERLVTGSDNRAYYTADHYNTFTEIK